LALYKKRAGMLQQCYRIYKAARIKAGK